MNAGRHQRARELSGNDAHIFSLELESGLHIRGARSELYSAFSNLIFNAVVYTPERGVIHIRWKTDGNCALLEIEDNGPGIAAEHISRLTERFYRTETSRSRGEGGTGLGLAIVKHVLIRHNAVLEIESAPGSGSLFRCRFPASELANNTVLDVAPEEGQAGA